MLWSLLCAAVVGTVAHVALTHWSYLRDNRASGGALAALYDWLDEDYAAEGERSWHEH
jgi:hypothetical protein